MALWWHEGDEWKGGADKWGCEEKRWENTLEVRNGWKECVAGEGVNVKEEMEKRYKKKGLAKRIQVGGGRCNWCNKDKQKQMEWLRGKKSCRYSCEEMTHKKRAGRIELLWGQIVMYSYTSALTAAKKDDPRVSTEHPRRSNLTCKVAEFPCQLWQACDTSLSPQQQTDGSERQSVNVPGVCAITRCLAGPSRHSSVPRQCACGHTYDEKWSRFNKFMSSTSAIWERENKWKGERERRQGERGVGGGGGSGAGGGFNTSLSIFHLPVSNEQRLI